MAQPPFPPSSPPPPYGLYGPPGYPVPPPQGQRALVRTILVLIIVAIALVALIIFAAVSLFGTFLGTSPRPVIAFANLQISNGNVSFAVGAASEQRPPSLYAFNMQIDSATGTSRPLGVSGDSTPIVIGPTTVRVIWTDVDGDGTVNRGDAFAIEGDGVPLPTGHSFVFDLIWSATGSTVGREAWAT